MELCLAYLRGAKTDGQVTENCYTFFNVLIFMVTKRIHLEISKKFHAEYFRNSQKEITKVSQL